MLFSPSELGKEDLEIIAKIGELHHRLRYAAAEPRRWMGLLRRAALARAIRGSNSIEGIQVSLDDAFAAVAAEEPGEAGGQTWAAVTGYREAMTFVLQLAGEEGWVYEENLLRALHFMMVGYDLAKRPGRWRRGDIFVVDEDRGETVYEGPNAELVPELMGEFVAELRAPSDLPMLIRGAMAHLNLVMIHPFRDGNGRMARCLQALVLAHEGVHAAPEFCSIEEYLGANEHRYYAVLGEVGHGAWHPERDTGPWVRFTLTAHYRQAATVLRRSKEAERLWRLAEHEVENAKLSERMVAPLYHALTGFTLRNATYRAIEPEVADATASRDLAAMVRAEILEPHGEKRGRFYTPVARLRDARLDIRRTVAAAVRLDADPYQSSDQ